MIDQLTPDLVLVSTVEYILNGRIQVLTGFWINITECYFHIKNITSVSTETGYLISSATSFSAPYHIVLTSVVNCRESFSLIG